MKDISFTLSIEASGSTDTHLDLPHHNFRDLHQDGYRLSVPPGFSTPLDQLRPIFYPSLVTFLSSAPSKQ